jgi:hypothetical protein
VLRWQTQTMNATQVRELLKSPANRLQLDHTRCGGWRAESAGYLDLDDPGFPEYVGTSSKGETTTMTRGTPVVEPTCGVANLGHPPAPVAACAAGPPALSYPSSNSERVGRTRV